MYNPKSEKVGTVWKTQIKKESSDYLIYFDLYFIADNMNTKYFMFCLVNFMSFVNIHPFLSFRPATHSKRTILFAFSILSQLFLIWGCTSSEVLILILIHWYLLDSNNNNLLFPYLFLTHFITDLIDLSFSRSMILYKQGMLTIVDAITNINAVLMQ